MIPVLWLCGPPGVGKTAAAWEIYQRLQRAGADPAYVDVDQLGICFPPHPDDPDRHTLKARNVAALRANFAATGARCLIVSGVVDAQRGPDTGILGDVAMVRLRVDAHMLRARLRQRGGPPVPQDAAVAEAQALDRSTFADWCIDTGALSIEEVAGRVLAGWQPRVNEQAAPLASQSVVPGAMLWLSGPTGAGKSTIGFRAYLDLLKAGERAAYIDIGQIGFCSTAPDDHALRARNLAAVWGNFHTVGARLAVVVGQTGDARPFEQVLPTVTLSWFSLHASDAELTRRILSRGAGGSWTQPGDPLRGRSEQELRAIAGRVIADRQSGFGMRIDVDRLSVDEAATALLTRWPATSSQP